MKKLLLCLTLLIAFKGYSQSAEEKAWVTYMTPGTEHQMLAKSNGTWKEDIKLYEKPDAPPTQMTSSCTNEMIYNGLYQKSTHKGQMMGMPFEGQSIVGYDNARKVWFSTWIDNMGSGIMYGEGKYDEATKMVEFKGLMTDPVSGKQLPFRETFKVVDDTHQEMKMYITTKGKESISMEMYLTKA